MRNAILVIFVAALLMSITEVGRGEEYAFVVPLPRQGDFMAGKGAESWNKMLKTIFSIAKEETGIVINVRAQINWTETMNDIEEGKGHLTFLKATDYVIAMKDNPPVTPWMSYRVEGDKYFSNCIYVNEAGGIKKTEDLRGKTIAIEELPGKSKKKRKYGDIGSGTAFFERIIWRKLLEKAGVREKMEDFAGEVKNTLNVETSMFEVMRGTVDATVASKRIFVLLKKGDPKFKRLKELDCVCEVPYAVIVHRNGMDKKVIEEMADFIFNIHKRDDFKDFQMISGVERFIPVKDSEYDPLRELWKEAREKGWVEED
ncbi:MAG: PhnD/SsuA/transferrin family substrate-binding protein [bacterium]